MNGPTLNPDYNKTLASWIEGRKIEQKHLAECPHRAAGCVTCERYAKHTGEIKPECEDCGKDLTGQDVIETPYDWRCVPCSKKPDDYVEVRNGPYWRNGHEDFYSDL